MEILGRKINLEKKYYILIFIAAIGLYLFWIKLLTKPFAYSLLLIAGAYLFLLKTDEFGYITLDQAEKKTVEEAEKRKAELRFYPVGGIINSGGKLQLLDDGHEIKPYRYVCGVKMLSKPEQEFKCFISPSGMIWAFDEAPAGFNIDDIPDVIKVYSHDRTELKTLPEIPTEPTD